MSLTNLYSIAKSLHLIGMVSWMAGLFYLVRIMVYHAEALRGSGGERLAFLRQYEMMEGKAYRVIVQPATVITWTFGVLMLCIQPAWLREGWLQAKLLFALLLTGYTHYCKSHIRRLAVDQGAFNHIGYRALNEIPTVFLVAIIFLAVFKSGINWLVFALGVGGFAALIFFAVKKANKRMMNDE